VRRGQSIAPGGGLQLAQVIEQLGDQKGGKGLWSRSGDCVGAVHGSDSYWRQQPGR